MVALLRTVCATSRAIAPANRPDSPLVVPTLTHLMDWGPFEAPPVVHLDAGYDSAKTRERLAHLGVTGRIARRGRPAPVRVSARWPVERTHAWFNAAKKLVWCTDRRTRVVHFWMCLVAVVIITRCLIHQGWIRYRWDTRPPRLP
ncbi:MAG: transposase [Thermomicrobiales bacterium]